VKWGAFVVAALAPALAAQPKTAQVSALEGRAQRWRGNGPRTELRVGSSVSQGDTLETQQGARLEVRFGDNSVLRLGPRAKVQLAEAHFGGAARRKFSARVLPAASDARSKDRAK